MHDDDKLRDAFRALGAESESLARDVRPSDLNAWRSELLRRSHRSWSAGTVLGVTAGAVAMLTIGLVLGASTGYASAEVVLREHGETMPALRPGLAVLKNIPPMVFACGSAPQIADVPMIGQQGVPVVDLPAPTAKTSVSQGGVLGVRQVANGNLLVNDGGRRQIKVFDSTLALVSVARDSAPGTATSYGERPIAMVPYLGDSTLLADYNAGSILVMAPTGQVTRAMAPLIQDMVFGLSGPSSKGVDAHGRILFSMNVREDPLLGLARARIPDSALLVRADMNDRKLDTIARLKSSGTTKLLGREGDGPLRFSVEPVPLTDDWALLSDGSIAIMRGRDYHIDWIHPDGSTTSTPKLPYDWKRITDDEKMQLVDSIRTVTAAKLGMAMGQRRVTQVDQAPGQRQRAPDVIQGNPMPTEFVAPDLKDIFDFHPPIHRGSLMPDLDGNLWILPTSSAQSKAGELVYDVVNPRGDFHRVRLPLGRLVVGFGKGGVVYLLSGDKANGFHVEKTRLPSK